MKKTLKRGFTLVELVIVIAVIAILSAVLIPTFGNVISNANDSAAFATASNAITKYTTVQASAGQSTSLPDGIVVVLKSPKGDDWNETTSSAIANDDVKYTFKFESGSLIQYADEDSKTAFDYNTLKSSYIKLEQKYNSSTSGYTVNAEGTNPIQFASGKATFTGAYVLDATITSSQMTGSVILLAKLTN